MPSLEAAITSMLERMREEYVSDTLPLDPEWRHVRYEKSPARPNGVGGGSQMRSPRAFVEIVKRIWREEGYLHRFQEAWLSDSALADLSYANNFDLWSRSNGLLERVARISLLHLLADDPDPIRADLISGFADDLRSDTQRIRAVAPISGVSLEGEALRLSEDVRIRCLTPLEHDFLVNSVAFANDSRIEKTWWRYPTVIETSLTADYHRNLETRLDEAVELVRTVRLLLSLVTQREVYSPGLFGSLETAFPVLINLNEPTLVPARENYPWPLPLDESMRADVVSAWQNTAQIEKTTSIAVDRLTFILDRDSDMDRLIDAWVALEALFSKSLGGELRYRLSIRIANYLGGGALERQTVFDKLYSAYGVRSKLVHGDKSVPSEDSLATAAADTVSIARRCLWQLLARGEDSPPTELDAAPFLII